MAGTKTWNVYHRDDTALLYPNRFVGGSLAFDSVDNNITRFPLAQFARHYRFRLNEGCHDHNLVALVT